MPTADRLSSAAPSLPRTGGIGRRRRALGFLLGALGTPSLTLLLPRLDRSESITTDVLGYQLLVVVVAMIGGLWPALATAIVSAGALDYFFVSPFYSVEIDDPVHLLALAIYVVIAILVSIVVDRAARRGRAASRAAAESELLSSVAGRVLRGEDAVEALLERTREALALDAVELTEAERISEPVLAAPPTTRSEPSTDLVVRGGRRLVVRGRSLSESDRRLLGVVVAQLDAELERRELSATAARMEPLEQADRVRSAVLAAVGHDLRRPLAAATTAVSGLESAELDLSDRDRQDLVLTARESLDALTALITDLLDASRVEAGVLAVTHGRVELADVVGDALDELGLPPGRVDIEPADEAPAVTADEVLLRRVVVNLLTNALRFSPPGRPPTIRIGAASGPDDGRGVVELRVIDHGPGIPAARRDDVFRPFQRLTDTDNTSGIGLGLAIARGFAEGMGGGLLAEETPDGGLTMVVSLPVHRETDRVGGGES